MSLKEKYQDVLNLGEELGVKDGSVEETDGKLKIGGLAAYQYDKDRLWDAIKTNVGWEDEITADIRVENTDVFGYHVVEKGDTLSKIARSAYDDVKQWRAIYSANQGAISNPDVIQPGQKLTLPVL